MRRVFGLCPQELLILVAEEQTGIAVSTTTMSRLLSTCGVRHGRPQPRVECPWSKAAKTRQLNAIRRLADEPRTNSAVLYVDEVDVHLNPKIGNDWMLEKQQKDELTLGQNANRYLLDATTGRLHWVEGPKKTSALFIALVDPCSRAARTQVRRFVWCSTGSSPASKRITVRL